MLALCAMKLPPTSGSVPAHFFPYGPDVGDQALQRVDGTRATLAFPSAFHYQGSTLDRFDVSIIIRPCLCMETISVCVL